VVVFSEEGIFQRRIGCESITNFPNGIDISGWYKLSHAIASADAAEPEL
jgi:hypothetical protein